MIFNLLLILILTFSCSENAVNSEDNKVIPKTDETETGNGFYATVRVLDRNGNDQGSYIFNAPESSGTLGGIVNMLSLSAEQIHPSTKNKDYISFNMIITDLGINLNKIPVEGVKISVSTKSPRDVFYSVFIENSSEAQQGNDIKDVDSESFIEIKSFKTVKNNKYEYLLAGNINCTFILKDETQREIKGHFQIPIMQVY